MGRETRKRIEHDLRLGLKKQIRFGESKHELKARERQACVAEEREYRQVKGIFSSTTLKAYQRCAKEFSVFAAERGARSGADAMRLVEPFIKQCIEKGQSAWTVHLKAYALCSAYGVPREQLISFKLPMRERKNITRSRYPTSSDNRHDAKTERIKRFAAAIGARRIGLTRLNKGDLIERDGKLFVRLDEKNGMVREAPVLPGEYEFVRSVFAASPGYAVSTKRGVVQRLFPKGYIPNDIDIHNQRSLYACRLYAHYAETGEHASGTVYRCRKERYGDVFDRGIMKAVSEALGHHRLDVVVVYLRQ